MKFERRQQAFTFSDGRKIVVHESNWDIATTRSALEAQARADKASQNGSGDPVLLYFRELIYPALCAPSTGDVPTAEQALHLPDADLDSWLDVVRSVNADWFPQITAESPNEEEIEFRDGSKLQVLRINRPSVLRRLNRLEHEIDQTPGSESTPVEVFRVLYYPKLAACSVGDVPTLEEARTQLPESELDKWYAAVRRVNPGLFDSLELIAERNQQAVAAEEKKSRKRRKPS